MLLHWASESEDSGRYIFCLLLSSVLQPMQTVDLELEKLLRLSIKAVELVAPHLNTLTFRERQYVAVHLIGAYKYAYYISAVTYIGPRTKLSILKYLFRE